jgi:hypothetical protein
MNVNLSNSVSFAKDNLNLAKAAVVNYDGRSITQFQHLSASMHKDCKVFCLLTATFIVISAIASQYLVNNIFKANKRSVTASLTFSVTLLSVYTGLSYVVGFSQTKTVSALILVSSTALRCLYYHFQRYRANFQGHAINHGNLYNYHGDFYRHDDPVINRLKSQFDLIDK